MKYGCYIFATDYSIRPDELARALEDRGFESFWVPEHTHIPAGRKAPGRAEVRCRGTTGIRWIPSWRWGRRPR
jgi:alkanesulfonate monooxygenase SsuD/methylene tetrahydromethanopterin reductase-like flavin-dependent oxidoreductase (luciferase family)